ncbi:MAG: FAD binding domain-containing protein [Actinomycetota bacterium]
MSVLMPVSLDEVYRALADEPEAHLLAGGTDLMVEVNYAGRRPPAVVGLRKVAELRTWQLEGDRVVIGAGMTWTDLMSGELAERFPILATASRTVGSPQIRNGGTIGGNVGTASPAGDGLPPLYALDAVVRIGSAAGVREQSIAEFITGVKRTTLAPGEVITGLVVPNVDGPQEYCKIGTRNAMVISAAGVAVVVDRRSRTVRCALGAVAPTIVRASEAEVLATDAVDWDAVEPTIADPAVHERFGDLAAAASQPIDDHRSSAEYRRHAISVMARRALLRCV